MFPAHRKYFLILQVIESQPYDRQCSQNKVIDENDSISTLAATIALLEESVSKQQTQARQSGLDLQVSQFPQQRANLFIKLTSSTGEICRTFQALRKQEVLDIEPTFWLEGLWPLSKQSDQTQIWQISVHLTANTLPWKEPHQKRNCTTICLGICAGHTSIQLRSKDSVADKSKRMVKI